MDVLVIVADEFKEFASQSSVMSYSALLEWLREGQVRLNTSSGTKFVAGQGLNDMEIDHAYRLAISCGVECEFEHWRVWRRNAQAERALCHKHQPENVLITAPEQHAGGLFVADVVLHARNELLLDHLTGQHVQGMVLTEACRQMFLAVTEKFCLTKYVPQKRYFVISEMNLRYLAFAFPLPAEIRYRIIDQQQSRPDRVTIHADMEVWQGSQAVAGMNVKFAVFDAIHLGSREDKLAAYAVEQHLDELRTQLGLPGRSGRVTASAALQAMA